MLRPLNGGPHGGGPVGACGCEVRACSTSNEIRDLPLHLPPPVNRLDRWRHASRRVRRRESSRVLRDRSARRPPLRRRPRPGRATAGGVLVAGRGDQHRGRRHAEPRRRRDDVDAAHRRLPVRGHDPRGRRGRHRSSRRPARRRTNLSGLARRADRGSRDRHVAGARRRRHRRRSRACRSRSAPPTTASSSSATCRRARPC